MTRCDSCSFQGTDREPIAWHGPIVMNSLEELTLAFDEYRQETFLKHKIKNRFQGVEGSRFQGKKIKAYSKSERGIETAGPKTGDRKAYAIPCIY